MRRSSSRRQRKCCCSLSPPARIQLPPLGHFVGCRCCLDKSWRKANELKQSNKMKHQQLYLKVLLVLVVVERSMAWEQVATAKPRSKAAKKAEEQHQQLVKNYAHFMRTAPHVSFAIHRRATIDCHLDEQLKGVDEYHLAWLKLNRSSIKRRYLNNQLVIGSNERVVLPDPRYRIMRENNTWWRLTIDDLRESDGDAFYLCQTNINMTKINLDIPANASREASMEIMFPFQRGARLRVLTPPRILEQETSTSSVIVREYEEAVLRCYVYSSNVSSFNWMRRIGPFSNISEDVEPSSGREMKRSPENPNMYVWHDWSQIKFKPFLREHAGIYFCYVTNNIEPGISRRFELAVVNCRVLNSTDSPYEPCNKPRYIPGQLSKVEPEADNEINTEQPTDEESPPKTSTISHHSWKTRPTTKKVDTTTTTDASQHLDQQEDEEPSIAFVLVSNSSSTQNIPLWLINVMILIALLMYHK